MTYAHVERCSHSSILLLVAADLCRQDTVAYDTNWSSTISCMLDKYRIHVGITSIDTYISDIWPRERQGMHLGCIDIAEGRDIPLSAPCQIVKCS